MNARMTISPTSAAPITSARTWAASNGNTVQPCGPARPAVSVPRPASWFTSPLNWPTPSRVIAASWCRPSRLTTSTAPSSTSQLGVWREPTS
jgi:hypothetical protein